MVIKKVELEKLDEEWIRLIVEAKNNKLTIEEIRSFLQNARDENS
jgi:DNA-binding transcriptional MerR regulator